MNTITPDLPPVRRGHRAPSPRKRRRVFLWVFLGIQALFLVWLITGAASTGSIHSDAATWCQAHHGFQTAKDCISSYGDGEKIGASLGIGVIILLWALVDVILGVGYGVYRLARR